MIWDGGGPMRFDKYDDGRRTVSEGRGDECLEGASDEMSA
jgi:hypothetical protein